MADQLVDILEAVQRPQIARLQAEVTRLREQLRIATEALESIDGEGDTLTPWDTAADALTRMSAVGVTERA